MKKLINSFKKVVKYKPLSSKKESKEIYIFCKGISKPFKYMIHNAAIKSLILKL